MYIIEHEDCTSQYLPELTFPDQHQHSFPQVVSFCFQFSHSSRIVPKFDVQLLPFPPLVGKLARIFRLNMVKLVECRSET